MEIARRAVKKGFSSAYSSLGATGFIGRALVPILRREGHQLIALVRSEERARSLLGAEVETVALSSGAARPQASSGNESDAVVNLAGEAIMGGRWTEGTPPSACREPGATDPATGNCDF